MAAIQPTNQEIILSPDTLLVIKTDMKAQLTYCNEAFVKLSGFTADEQLTMKLYEFQHPDMPSAIFLYMKKRLEEDHEFIGFIKGLTKPGDYYWTLTQVTRRRDAQGNQIGFHVLRRKANPDVIPIIEKLYSEMKQVESHFPDRRSAFDDSFAVLQNFLDSKGKTHKEFVFDYAL